MARRPCFKLEIGYPEPLAGVDEAGCAPLAGPVVAAAVILDRNKFPRGIDDSKNLPLEKREALYSRLVKCAAWGVGIASVEEIDTINIYWARMLAMTRAVEALGSNPPGCWSTAMPARAGSGRPRRSSTATPSAVRSPPPRSSPRSRATGSWPNMRGVSGLRLGDEPRLRDARALPRSQCARPDSAPPAKLRTGARDRARPRPARTRAGRNAAWRVLCATPTSD
jgi:hypothetical protein